MALQRRHFCLRITFEQGCRCTYNICGVMWNVSCKKLLNAYIDHRKSKKAPFGAFFDELY
jgi:hypothetical protein